MVQRTLTTDKRHGSIDHGITAFAVETNEQAPQLETPDLSIVTSLYRSASFLEQFYKRTCAVASQITSNFEIIFVNDGSPDNSLEVALQLQELDPRIIVIDLSRNFGEHKAVMTGLRQSRGELVFRIHCDLDEPPEALLEFHQELTARGIDSIYGVQENREGSFVKNQMGAAFYGVFNSFSPVPIPKNALSCRLMTRRFVNALLEHEEQRIFLAGLYAIVGFDQSAVKVVKTEKRESSTYTTVKRLSMMATAITSFSDRPLLVIPVIGLIVLSASILAAIAGGVVSLSGLWPIAGWFWIVVSIWSATGLILACLGIISFYMMNLQAEVKNRPYTTVRAVYKNS